MRLPRRANAHNPWCGCESPPELVAHRLSPITAHRFTVGYGRGAQHDSLRQFFDQRGYELLTVTSDVVSGADSARMYGRE
jgi:hypothetical protein